MTEQVWDILRVATVIKPSIVIEITKLPMIHQEQSNILVVVFGSNRF